MTDARASGSIDKTEPPSVAAAYDARAVEYTEAFGSMDTADAEDQAVITEWAATAPGRILDLGCGPGRWIAHLHDQGHDVLGLDPSASFISIARATHPGVAFRRGDTSRLDASLGDISAILAWYSLIHLPPADLPDALRTIRAVLPAGGRLLIGFFNGPDGEPFPHRITRAWTWSVPGLSALLGAAGFAPGESHRRNPPGARPHADLAATAR